MSVPTTYAGLQTELARLAVREDDADLEVMLPSFIAYAENWFQRELFSPERLASVTLTVTDGVASLPDDFGGLVTIYVNGSIDNGLDRLSADELRRRYPTTTTGTPYHFAIEGTTILFGPIPTDDVIILKYVEGVEALSDDNTTNWLLTAHPDLYVNACMAELYEYTRDPEPASVRRQKAAGIIESINRQSQRRKANSGPLRASTRLVQVGRKMRA